MNLQLRQREKQGIRILDLQGRLVIGDSEAILRTTIVALAEARVVNIILDLAGVTEIDEDALGALVFCYGRIGRSGGALKVLNLSPLHLSLMVLTKLYTVFESLHRRAGCGQQLLSGPHASPLRYSRVASRAGKSAAPHLPR
jgi:anti-sigma B factor antagonist